MSEEQKKLVSVLDSVHNQLRTSRRQCKDNEEWKKLWEQHTADFQTLQEYSSAMHQLATKIWDPRNTVAPEGNFSASDLTSVAQQKGKLKCRLQWVVNHCIEYFKIVIREEFEVVQESKLKLLDVGSCYNPFSKFSLYFDIVALDLCPAPGFEQEVFQCDFLELKVVDKMEEVPRIAKFSTEDPFIRLTELPRCSFDILVFSYFLEYLADSKQRVECCEKAFSLLKPNGLLFILRPDSNKVTPGGNSALIKKMKLGMLILGFKRIHFEKLEHLWCMAFKKLDEDEKKYCLEGSYFKKDIAKAGFQHLIHNTSGIHELFQIAQDFKERTIPESVNLVPTNKGVLLDCKNIELDKALLNTLPCQEQDDCFDL